MRRSIGFALILCSIITAVIPVLADAETVVVQATRVYIVHRSGQVPVYILPGFMGRVETFHGSTITVIWDYAYVNGQLQKDVAGRVPTIMVDVIEVQPD